MNKKVYGDIIQLFEKLVLNIDVKINSWCIEFQKIQQDIYLMKKWFNDSGRHNKRHFSLPFTITVSLHDIFPYLYRKIKLS